MTVLHSRGWFSPTYPLSPFVLGIGLFVDGYTRAREEHNPHHAVLHGAQTAITHPLIQNIMANQVASGVGPK